MVALERKTPAEGVFADFKDHFSDTVARTQLVITESLRRNYPKYHVTCASGEDCDLLGYAAAGHAETSPLLDDELSDIVRHYKVPKHRLDSGTLTTEIRWGQHTYKWHGTDFLLFNLVFPSGAFARDQHRFYILAPHDSADIAEGCHPKTDALMLEAGAWTRLLHKEVFVFDDGCWVKSKSLWKAVDGSSWDDVILSAKTKQSLIEDVSGFFDSRDLYREYSVEWRRGIIIHGLPGNGKTMSIRAIMNSLSARPDQIPTLYVKSLRSCDGPQYSIRRIFQKARASSPCLVILEDLDSLITEKVRSYFLNEIDGLESNDGILIIGSTNHLAKLDPAISKRPSRFDRKYHFDLPGEAERTAYCEYWRGKLTKNNRIAFPESLSPVISKLTEGFTFAYMKELFVASLLVLARGGTGREEPESEAENDEEFKAVTQVTLDSAGDKVAEDKAEEKEKAEPKKKRVLPKVSVPEALQGNTLLNVFTQQAAILLAEMDNTKEEDWKSSAATVRADDGDDSDSD